LLVLRHCSMTHARAAILAKSRERAPGDHADKEGFPRASAYAGHAAMRSALIIGTRCFVVSTWAWYTRGDRRNRDASQPGPPRGLSAASLGSASQQLRSIGGWAWCGGGPPARSRPQRMGSPCLARRPLAGPTRPPHRHRGSAPSCDLAGVLANRPTGSPRPATFSWLSLHSTQPSS
jgi:hypothetical protein